MPVYATIDIGSNSVLVFVAEKDEKGNWKTLAEKAEITRLGEGLKATGRLSKEAMERTAKAVCDFAALARDLGAEKILAVGTMALRTASNSNEFIKLVKDMCDVDVEVIPGEEEARLSFLAVKSGLKTPADRVVVIDVGGGSTEFIFGKGDEIEKKFSLNIGAIRFTEDYLKHDPPEKGEINAMLSAIESELGDLEVDFQPDALLGIGGTITNLAAVKHKMEKYDPEIVDGTELTLQEVEDMLWKFSSMTVEERKKIPGLQPKRADVIIAGTGIVYTIMKKLGLPKLTVSVRGVRHGLMFDRFGK